MHKAIKYTVILLIIITIIVAIIIKSCTRNVVSICEIEEVLPVDLYSDQVEIKDIITEDYIIETRLVLFYEVSDFEFDNKDYYQYKTDYNPLPSYNKDNKYIDDISEYLLEFNLNGKDIEYVNFIFSQYRGIDLETKIYVFSKTNDESTHKIVLLSDFSSKLNIEF